MIKFWEVEYRPAEGERRCVLMSGIDRVEVLRKITAIMQGIEVLSIRPDGAGGIFPLWYVSVLKDGSTRGAFVEAATIHHAIESAQQSLDSFVFVSVIML